MHHLFELVKDFLAVVALNFVAVVHTLRIEAVLLILVAVLIVYASDVSLIAVYPTILVTLSVL